MNFTEIPRFLTPANNRSGHAGTAARVSPEYAVEELVKLAKQLDAASKLGEELGLTHDEIAFYDALASNESGVQTMNDDKLKVIAAQLITQVEKSVTIDWTFRESARANIK